MAYPRLPSETKTSAHMGAHVGGHCIDPTSENAVDAVASLGQKVSLMMGSNSLGASSGWVAALCCLLGLASPARSSSARRNNCGLDLAGSGLGSKPVNEEIELHAKHARDRCDRIQAGLFQRSAFDMPNVGKCETCQFRKVGGSDLAKLPGVVKPLGERARKCGGHLDTSVAIDTDVVKTESRPHLSLVSDTIVSVSRAASKPLPPPPPNSVWARVEEAREEEGLTYGRFSRLAGKKIGHYRTIATRGKWVSQDATRDQFVRALVKLGWSREWLVLGVGERRTDGKSSSEERHAASVEELNLMRWRAIRELVDVDGIDLARAGQLVGRVRIFRRPDVSWGDYYSAARHIAREEDKAERAKRSEKPAV